MIESKHESEEAWLLTVRQVLSLCQVGRTFLYEQIRSNRLRATKIGRLTRFRREDVEAWLRSFNASPNAGTRSDS